MRPPEIDFRDRRNITPYYDLNNGEVLLGVKALREYKAEGADPANIAELGVLLRDGTPPDFVPPPDRVDTSEWTEEQFVQCGKWVRRFVAPPEDARHRKLTREIFINARRLGLGPHVRQIKKQFGIYPVFYSQIGEGDITTRHLFDDWTLSDYVDYVKQVGDDSSTRLSFNRFTKLNPKYPKPQHMDRRFESIGGFTKIRELAGFQVIRLWDHQDYINWGVKFMQANDGMPPLTDAVNYLSKSKKGPSSSSAFNKFGSRGEFQKQVIREYYQQEAERKARLKEITGMAEDDLRRRIVPIELFVNSPNPDVLSETEYKEEYDFQAMILDKYQKKEPLIADLGARYGEQEIVQRYAKFRVMASVVPYVQSATIINEINNQEPGEDFTVTIRRHFKETPANIENAALLLGFFDEIWPMDDHLKTLKLDEGYEEYRKAVNRRSNMRRKEKSLVAR